MLDALIGMNYLCLKMSHMVIITIETSGAEEVEQLLRVLKSLNIGHVHIQDAMLSRRPVIVKGDKKLDPKGLMGIWRNQPRTSEQIRALAWERRQGE